MTNFRKLTAIVSLLFLSALQLNDVCNCSTNDDDQKAAAHALNEFSVDLFARLRQSDENLICSPYCVGMSLAMAYAGARGTTESQIAGALHLKLPRERVIDALSALNSNILDVGKGKVFEINIANGIWAERSFPLLKEFLESTMPFTKHSGWFAGDPILGTLKGLFGMNDQGCIRQVDFKSNAESTRDTINRWVERQTNDKIKEPIPPDAINSGTRLVLTNAIYFKGEWASPFKESNTRDLPFHLLDGTQISVPIMMTQERFGYAEEPDLQVLEIPYQGVSIKSHVEMLSMVVLLPSRKLAFEDFERSITYEKIRQWTGNLAKTEVMVFLPKFKMTSSFTLRTALSGLGISDAFSQSDADFSGMTGKRDLYLQQGHHKAFVETNEHGVEAAAATGLETRVTGIVFEKESPPQFLADHPFVFFIRHKPSDCNLFMGRVTAP